MAISPKRTGYCLDWQYVELLSLLGCSVLLFYCMSFVYCFFVDGCTLCEIKCVYIHT